MEFVLLAVVVGGFTAIYGRIWLRRRREAPLRREIRARDVSFWTSLDFVKISDSDGWPRWLGLNAPMALFVRGDAFEVSSTFAPIRIAMGFEYYFKANETSVEVSRAPSRISKRVSIVVTGRQLDKEIQLAIASKYKLHLAWNALVSAGATPTGLPPQDI
jgi:hypothetical protein